MDLAVVSLLFAVCVATIGKVTNKHGTATPPAPPRFQAEKFLDMLGTSYDSKLAFADLLTALHRRLNLDSANQSNGSLSIVDGGSTNVNALAETVANCQEAPSKKGATITYTSATHTLGSRALYQCQAGYSGKSKFIQCEQGGQWSLIPDWSGCIPVDCGPVPPSVPNAETSFTTTVFASIVVYSCQSGYKMNTTSAKITCLETGIWEVPSFVCEKENIMPVPQVPPTILAVTTKPAVKAMPGGFQLPSHLLNLLPNGIPNAAGIKPENLMTLASLGLGSAHPAAAPRDISQLLGSMNPMSMFGGSMGLGGTGPGAAGGPGATPPDPELMAEQREELMFRQLMASAMKSMMSPGMQANTTTSNHNPAMELMTMMALQNGLSGSGAGTSAGGAAGGFDPLSMMLGGMGGGAGGTGLFGGLFGQA